MRYLQLLWVFFKLSLQQETQYRLNFVVKIFNDILWYATQLAFFEVLFYRIPSVQGWTIESARVLMGMLFVVDAVWMVLSHLGLEKFPDMIRKGELDLLLTKPVDSMFMIWFRNMNAPYVINLVITSIWLGWSIQKAGAEISVLSVFMVVVLVIAGYFLVQASRFIFTLPNVVLVRAEGLGYLWSQFYRMGARPHTLYPGWIKWILFSVVPMAFVASIPSQILMNVKPPVYLLTSVLLSISFVLLSRLLWKLSLKKYASASS